MSDDILQYINTADTVCRVTLSNLIFWTVKFFNCKIPAIPHSFEKKMGQLQLYIAM